LRIDIEDSPPRIHPLRSGVASPGDSENVGALLSPRARSQRERAGSIPGSLGTSATAGPRDSANVAALQLAPRSYSVDVATLLSARSNSMNFAPRLSARSDSASCGGFLASLSNGDNIGALRSLQSNSPNAGSIMTAMSDIGSEGESGLSELEKVNRELEAGAYTCPLLSTT